MNGFDWDEENINHLARHNINPQKAEELFNRDPSVRPDTPEGERRFPAYGHDGSEPFTPCFLYRAQGTGAPHYRLGYDSTGEKKI